MGVNPTNTEVTSNPQHARMIPDVSMIADNLFVYTDDVLCYTTFPVLGNNGIQIITTPVSCTSSSATTYNTYDSIQSNDFGGTSAAAPLWAGLAALINQVSVTGKLGSANPKLYALATTSAASYASNFHDVNDGSNNNFPSSDSVADTGPYHAVQGYDLTTGLGSPACNLLAAGGVCVPGTTYCTSETQVMTCGTTGVWGASTCPDACVSGNCGGVCVPGTTQCTSGTEVETCDANGQWGAPTTCTTVCVGPVGTVGGNCGGCVPGTTQCTSETEVEACSSSGQWGAPTTCSDACVGPVGTVGGSCGGVCMPGAQQCVQNGDTCLVDGVQTCSNDLERCSAVGQWGAAAPCTYGLAQAYGPYGGVSCIPPGSAGSTTHSNGTGQTFTDCAPQGTYTGYSAAEACLSLIEVNPTLAAPVGSCFDCGGYEATFYGGQFYSWIYEGFFVPAGTAVSCSAPTLSQLQEENTNACGFTCSASTLSTWN
ncbi:MAG TPA: hypothetical protein VNW92_17950 [Polyangiaceae bacterium]|nr:hypothetical protein [Polyangiaceae bacterium]